MEVKKQRIKFNKALFPRGGAIAGVPLDSHEYSAP